MDEDWDHGEPITFPTWMKVVILAGCAGLLVAFALSLIELLTTIDLVEPVAASGLLGAGVFALGLALAQHHMNDQMKP